LVKKNGIELLEKLKKGEDFAKLAEELSECDSSSKGGMLGTFSSGQMVAEFERAVHNLKDDEITEEPVKSDHGYHIIQRLKL